jgi:hypothetical protein
MQLAAQVERLLFVAPASRLVAAVLLIGLIKTGVWQIPNFGASRLIAQNPFANPFQDPNAHALYWSWLGPFLAWLIDATSPPAFFLFHLVFSAGFAALFIATAFRHLPAREARVSLVLFAVLPVSATAFFWVSTDSLTLFLMMLALALPPRWPVAALFGTALGMQHFEQAFFGFGGLLVALLLSRWGGGQAAERPLRWVLALLLGTMAGKLALVGLFQSLGVQVNSGRLYWLKEHLPLLVEQFFFHLHVILFSVLGLGWLVAVKYLERGRESLPFPVALGGLMLLLPISGDQTRVLAVVTFPLLTIFWLLNGRFLASLSNRSAAWLFLAWVIVPWGWVWGGIPRWSAFPYDLAYLLHHWFGWPESLPDPFIGSF